MASSAAHISVQTSIQAGASVHAPHGKAHNKAAASGDSFADMLAGAREENVRAGDTSAKAASNDKPTPKDRASGDVATEQKETGKAPAEGQTETAQTAEDAQPASEGQTQTGAANDNVQANDNAEANTEDGALVDVAAALPQTAEPAPAPQQPTPVPALAAQPSAPGETQPALEGDADTDEADIAPVAGNAPAKAAPQVPDSQNTQKNSQNAPDAGGKPAAPGLTTAKDTVTDLKAASSDFSKALQETQTGPESAQAAPAAGETAKPAETAATAPRPSPETNTITLAMPAAPAHQPQAPQGAEKLVLTAQTGPEGAPQATPNVSQMAVEVAARSQSGAKQFEIRLDPPELGRVEVRLSIDAHGKAEAHLTADQPQTLELLQKDAPTLARALRDAGLNVAQDALNFSLKNQQGHAGGDDASRQGARGNFHNPRTQAENSQPESGAYIRRGLGLLDIKV